VEREDRVHDAERPTRHQAGLPERPARHLADLAGLAGFWRRGRSLLARRTLLLVRAERQPSLSTHPRIASDQRSPQYEDPSKNESLH
jgi:hypothetical protein